jgi:hypothetical protein
MLIRATPSRPRLRKKFSTESRVRRPAKRTFRQLSARQKLWVALKSFAASGFAVMLTGRASGVGNVAFEICYNSSLSYREDQIAQGSRDSDVFSVLVEPRCFE